jgi:hypothetical protein
LNLRQDLTADGIVCSHDLGDVAAHCRPEADLMRHRATRDPGRLSDLRSENLTGHQADEIHRLIARLGLAWQAACLSPQTTKGPSARQSFGRCNKRFTAAVRRR